MAPDLIDISKIFHYLNDNGESRELKGTLYLNGQDKTLMYSYTEFDNTPHEFTFKMKKKQWYRVQKSLGLVKPIYKKKRKGKRYVWYEVI